ncbi:MAG: ABC transporter permease subunit [Pseudomonadota bacterium]
MVSYDDAISRRRRFKDRAATIAINIAGWGTVALISLILVYLVSVALPLGLDAEVSPSFTWTVSGDEHPLIAADGETVVSLSAVEGARPELARVIDAFGVVPGASQIHVYRLQAESSAVRPERLTTVAPLVSLTLPAFRPESLAIDFAEDELEMVVEDLSGKLQLIALNLSASEPVISNRDSLQLRPDMRGGTLLPRMAGNEVLVVQGDRYLRWGGVQAAIFQAERIVGGQLQGVLSRVSAAALGPGGDSLQIADDDGQLHRFDLTRDQLPRLGGSRDLAMSVRVLISERARRVTGAISSDGELLLLQPASGDVLYRGYPDGLDADAQPHFSDEGHVLIQQGLRETRRWAIDNPYPETGIAALWRPQRLPGYDKAVHVWHPDGESIGVLSKYSLSPLLYGTFKAALYGMLLAVPLALGAAVYIGYFLPSRQRNQLKPALETLEAFPTVVLGFVAGIWLAPLLADYLLLILFLPVIGVGLPLLLSLGHAMLQHIDPRFSRRPPRMLLLTSSYAAALLCLAVFAPPPETLDQLTQSVLWDWFGLRYDQRNAVLVGLVMGIAIMPAMFSIMEDAIHAVPRSLSDGSLALGATRWQSLARVVFPAASPAMLSALLIGLARGLGETMIVLLATGNMPIMEPDPFSSLRSLSATIAIELPEAGSESVQFRLLFLTALVLFGLTFLMNTLAELFRQRLRYAYAHANR